jgi:hypothetical protein
MVDKLTKKKNLSSGGENKSSDKNKSTDRVIH